MIRVFPVVVGVVASSVGCAQLAGIDGTNGTGRNGNSLAVTRMSIGNTVVTTPLDLTGLQATYLKPTGAAGSFEHVMASQSGPGVWTQDLADATPVEFTLPDVPTPLPRIFKFPNRALSVLFSSLEHPNHSPAPTGAMLTVTTLFDAAPAPAPGDIFQAYTVGSWTSHDLVPAAIGPTQITFSPYAFNTSTNLSGRPEFDRLTTQDAFLVLRYSGTALTGVAEAPPFDQTGADMVVTQKMSPVVQDQTLDVKVSPPTLAMRYAAVRPTVGSLGMNWSLVAAPGYRIASTAGPGLQNAAMSAADVGVIAKYGNPFTERDWHTVFALFTSESRTTTPAGATLPVTLSAGMNQYLEPSLVPPGFELTLPAGLPTLISIDGQPLLTDDQKLVPPTKFVEVTFRPDNANATLFNLQVFDLLPNATATALVTHPVFSAASNEAKFAVPPEIFQPGHSYTLRAMCNYEGYPAIADGDFTERQLPLSQSYLDSGVITVMP